MHEKNFKFSAGFTLLELLITISIITLLFTIGIASYQNFNRTQIVNQTVKELKENLRLVQSKALSGEKTSACGANTLIGWQINFTDSNTYKIQVLCSATPSDVKTIDLTGDLVKTAGPNTVLFRVLARGVDGSGEIIIKGFGSTKVASVTVSNTGEIK